MRRGYIRRPNCGEDLFIGLKMDVINKQCVSYIMENLMQIGEGVICKSQYSLQSWLHEPLLDVLFVHPNKVSQGIYGAHGLLQYNENKDTLAVCQS